MPSPFLPDPNSTLALRREVTINPGVLTRELCEVELPLIEAAVLGGQTKRQVLDLLHDLKGRLRNTRVVAALAAQSPPPETPIDESRVVAFLLPKP